MSPSLPSLPVEILENIFERLCSPSLISLARTNTNLYPTASRFLYHDVSVSSFARNLSAVTTLATRRHLALLVRKFSISLDDGKDQVDGEYYTLLCHAVRSMEGLITLELNVDASCSWILAASAPPDCSGPHVYHRLEHFSCSFPLDAHSASFLERTPQLKSLQLATSPDFIPLSPSAIPYLNTYTGPPCLLPQLLPSRPIATLHLSGDLTLGDIQHLARASRAPTPAASAQRPEFGQSADCGCGANVQVETLSTITSSPPVAVIKALAEACPGLVSLRMITTCAFWQTPDVTSYPQVASSLTSLPSLSAFELDGMHWEVRPNTAPAADGRCRPSGKEWVSPPVTPRPVDVDTLNVQDQDLDFTEAFMEWAY